MDDPVATHAGMIVFNRAGRILLVSALEAVPEDWVLPKGHIEPGEPAHITAIREVAEEAGVEATLDGDNPIALSSYSLLNDDKTVKEVVVVTWFVGRGHKRVDPTENRKIRWVHHEAALQMVRYPDLRFVIREALCLEQENDPD